MKEAHRRTRKTGAQGVDGRSAAEFAVDLDENLRALLDQAKSGTYRAPSVRRVHIPKGDGKETRPIGIPTFADKVLQRAVAMALGAVYEQDFLDCSYGFRPRRSAHGALHELREQLMVMRGGWVLEIDVRRFFDTLGHAHLMDILRLRIRDGVILRLIGKWLNAGVLEDGMVFHPDSGSPQGGVISPLLANVYLHEVLDTWFERTVKPRLRGRAFLIRYADDAVLGFEQEDDARRVMAVLAKRFAKYGLALHPEKTRLVPFRRPLRERSRAATATFDMLGFTHAWGRSRKGNWVVQRRTAKDRFTRSLRAIRAYCQGRRHEPIKEQHTALCQKLLGHYGYFGLPGNSEALARLRYESERIWVKWLARRSCRGFIPWEHYSKFAKHYPLPRPRMVAREANS